MSDLIDGLRDWDDDYERRVIYLWNEAYRLQKVTDELCKRLGCKPVAPAPESPRPGLR